jgi:hypothetical protein
MSTSHKIVVEFVTKLLNWWECFSHVMLTQTTPARRHRRGSLWFHGDQARQTGVLVVSYEDCERMVETLKLKENHRFNRYVGQGLAEARVS